MSRYRKVWIREYKGKKDTTYRVCFYDCEMKARRTLRTFHSKRIAKGYKDKYQAYLNGEGPHPDEPVEGMEDRVAKRPWSETASAWIESGATKPKTRKTYRYFLDYFARETGIGTVEEVSETQIADFLTARHQSGKSLATCAAYLRTLAAFLRWARPEDSPIPRQLIQRWNPYKRRKRARPHYYTKEEYHALLTACNSIVVNRIGQRTPLWWKCYISILYHAAIRLNEVVHLIWRDVDFNKGILKIHPHVRLKGVFEWGPKGKARRAIPVPDDVMNFLAKVQQQQEEGIPYVFVSKSRYLQLLAQDKPNTELLHGIPKGFRHLRNVAGIDEGNIHDMRRTAITNWTKQGLTPKDVQLLAGHEDLNTTLEIYAMVQEEDVVEKARKLIQTAVVDRSSQFLD